MKILFCVLDGMSGRPGEVGKKTALEAARKPNMNRLIRNAKVGMINVIRGIAPESDAAVLSLLGYDPFKHHVRRGVLEVIGAGLKFKEGMLAARANFASSLDGKRINKRRVKNLSKREVKELTKAIEKIKIEGIKIRFRSTLAHRGVLLIKSRKKLSGNVTNTDPAYKLIKKIPHSLMKFKMEIKESRPLKEEAKYTAYVVNKFSNEVYNILKNHPVNKKRLKKGQLPANILLLRDMGTKLPNLTSISKKYKKKCAIIADFPVEIGIGKAVDMDIIPLPIFIHLKDYTLRAKKTLGALKKYGFVYIHLKGPDLYGHAGDPKGKRKCIEDIDKYFFDPLLKKINLKDTIIVITADHTTPCSIKTHSSDPVPLMISSPSIKSDNLKEFGERNCKKGSLHLQGPKLLPYLMSLI